MCGIAGTLNFRGSQDGTRWSTPERIRHRGPDGSAIAVFELSGGTPALTSGALSTELPRAPHLVLAHTRLSIIDLAGGAQPLSIDGGKHWIAFNGELYNYRELREEFESLGAPAFRTSSDTEVVLRALAQWGLAALSRFNGMFAFAWWDAEKRELLLARDPAGIKPLYYASTASSVEFASELKALEASRRNGLEPRSLELYLALGYLPAPYTLRTGVQKLRPGHWVRFTDHGATEQNPFRYAPQKQSKPTIENLRVSIDEAVNRQMVADVPVGVFLSGGLDSTLVATLMAKHHPAIDSFSIGSSEGEGENENTRAELVAKRLGLRHHSFEYRLSDGIELAEKAFAALDEPTTSSSFIPLYFLARETRNHLKVVLAGQGADELFGGYNRYRAARGWEFARTAPRFARETIAQTFRLTNRPKLRQFADLLVANTPEDAARAIYAREGGNAKRLNRGLLAGFTAKDLAVQFMAWDRTHLLADDLLLYGDRMTMAHGLEMRVPLLDLELIHAVDQFQASELLPLFGARKSLLRKAVPADMPREPLHWKKIGFATPINEWLDGSLKDWVYEIPEKLSVSDAIPKTQLDRWYAEREKSSAPLFERELWSVACLGAAMT